MTIDAYINPDFSTSDKINFLIMAFGGVIICVFLIMGWIKLTTLKLEGDEKKFIYYERTHNHIQKFYEMMISATSVMSFACAYVIINHIYALIMEKYGGEGYDTFVKIWENGRDFILLLLICLSVVINTILDKIFIPLKKITREEKSSIRMLAMFYVIVVLIVLNQIGDESEYNPVMIYYLGLMVGRFVYFDASFKDFIEALKNAFKSFPLFLMGLILMGFMCFVGFKAGYLLERNYYIVGAFYTQLFILFAIFVIHLSHIFSIIVRKPAGYDEKLEGRGFYYDEEEDEYEEDEDEDEYDEYGEDD